VTRTHADAMTWISLRCLAWRPAERALQRQRVNTIEVWSFTGAIVRPKARPTYIELSLRSTPVYMILLIAC